MAEASFHLRRSLHFDTVRWGKVLDLLATRFTYSFSQADTLLHQFMSKFRGGCFYWFSCRKLSPAFNDVVLALCQCHGTDALTIVSRSAQTLGTRHISIQKNIFLQPQKDSVKPPISRIRASIDVELGRLRFTVTTLPYVTLAYTLVLSVAAVMYIVIVASIFLGLALLFCFMQSATTLGNGGSITLTVVATLLMCLAGFGIYMTRASKSHSFSNGKSDLT